MSWAKILNHGSSVILRPLKVVGEKILATLAILGGVLGLLIVLDGIFDFTSVVQPEPGVGLFVGFTVVSLVMMAAGTWWFMDSAE